MKSSYRILIITDPVDPHAEAVMDCLEARGESVLRFHPAEVLRGFSATCIDIPGSVQEFVFKTPAGFVSANENLRSIYYRNTDKVRPPKQTKDKDASMYAADESEMNIRDLWEAMPGYWLTRPSVIKHAQSKMLQLRVAGEVGLNVPKSCWSNNTEEILEFLNRCEGRIVAKPISDVQYYMNGQPHTVWVSRITKDFLLSNQNDLPLMVTFYQEHIDREVDIRATVVGDQVLACRMIIPPEKRHIVDWRTLDFPLKYERAELPEQIRTKLLRLNKGLGVDFGAMDLVLDKRGEYYFLESNINGQWLWIQQLTGLPIAESIANLLIKNGYIS